MNNSFSRRSFLIKGAAIAAGCAASARFAASAIDERGASNPSIRLGLASYTLRNFSRSQVIANMKQLDLHFINAKDTKDHLPMDAMHEAAAVTEYATAGIKVTAVGTVYFLKDEDDDIRSKFEYCKRAGASVIVAGDPAMETLPRIEKFAKQYDIRIAIHNHGPEDKLWPSPLDVLKAVKDMDKRMGCCIDVGHTLRAGTDVVEAIREAGPRLFNIHMKDLTDPHGKESQVAVGEGMMPVGDIFAALIAIKYQGFVDLEYEIHPDDPMPGVTSSFAYMRRVMSEMHHA